MARNNRTQESGEQRRKVTLADKRLNRNRGSKNGFEGYQRLTDFMFDQQEKNSR